MTTTTLPKIPHKFTCTCHTCKVWRGSAHAWHAQVYSPEANAAHDYFATMRA